MGEARGHYKRELGYQEMLTFFEAHRTLIIRQLGECGSREKRERIYEFLAAFVTDGALIVLRKEFGDSRLGAQEKT